VYCVVSEVDEALGWLEDAARAETALCCCAQAMAGSNPAKIKNRIRMRRIVVKDG
jgi:hypothetical protein